MTPALYFSRRHKPLCNSSSDYSYYLEAICNNTRLVIDPAIWEHPKFGLCKTWCWYVAPTLDKTTNYLNPRDCRKSWSIIKRGTEYKLYVAAQKGLAALLNQRTTPVTELMQRLAHEQAISILSSLGNG